jgi:hypothetical protein
MLLCFTHSTQAVTEAEVDQFKLDNRHGDVVITRRDYEKSFNQVMKEAQSGDRLSQYVLAEYYEFGLTGKIDLVKSLEWYMKSANQGYTRSQKKVALFYINGKGGIDKSERDARIWLEKAVAQNDTDAQFELGISLCYSKTLPLDCIRGIELLKAAGLSKDEISYRALYVLGDIYYFGINVPKNNVEAVKWFKLSADHNNADALFMLAKIYEFGGDGIQPDSKKSIENYTAASRKGHTESQYYLGYYYLAQNNYESALKWFSRAAESNNREALFALGIMHEKGLGVEKDSHKAFEYYLSAAQLKNPSAQIAVAIMYENGWGPSKDLIEAFAWYSCSNTLQSNEQVQQQLYAINSTLTESTRSKAMDRAKDYSRKFGTQK